MNVTPLRHPDVASIQATLGGLDPASPDTDLVPALAAAFPGFDFNLVHLDDEYWRDTRSVIRPDRARVGELQPWMTAELAKDGGDTQGHLRLRVCSDRRRSRLAAKSSGPSHRQPELPSVG